MTTGINPEAGGESRQLVRDALRYDEFISSVQREAGLATPGAAALAARATLRALLERLQAEVDIPEERSTAEELIHDVYVRLPGRLREELGEFAPRDDGTSAFSLMGLFERVAERTGVGLAEAERHARAVAVTLDAAIPGPEVDRLRSRLPDEFELLFV